MLYGGKKVVRFLIWSPVKTVWPSPVLTLCVLVGAVDDNTWGLGEICNGFGRVRSVEIMKAASWPEQVLADQESNLRKNGFSAFKRLEGTLPCWIT